MEFCLERFALYKLNDYLSDGKKSLFQNQPLTIAIAGFPDYALQSEGFSALINEIHKFPKNFYTALESWPDIKDFPIGSINLLIAHRRFFYGIPDEELQEFSREVNRALQPDGLVFAFHQTCLWEGKEKWARSIKNRIGFEHYYRRSFRQFRRLTSPLKTILEADLEDSHSYVSASFSVSVLARSSAGFNEVNGLQPTFVLESYNPDYWSQRGQPVLTNR